MNRQEIQQCLYKIAYEEDTGSFRQLYRHYFSQLLQFSFIIVHTKEPAEEIVNDVFINLWKRRTQLYKIENPDVYLYVAVKNKSLDYLSKAHLREQIDINKISEDYLQFSFDPEQIMITNELKTRIEKGVNQLPSRCKLIFRLIREDGLKYKDVAAILNLSVKTIEAQMAIAVKKLSGFLNHSLPQNKKTTAK